MIILYTFLIAILLVLIILIVIIILIVFQTVSHKSSDKCNQ